jgi:hypothetical protein
MNKFIVSGYLTKDPVLKTGKSGLSYCTIDVINKDNRVPVVIPIMVFGKDADTTCKYLTKARAVEVEAKIEKDTRTDGLMYISEKVIFGDKPFTKAPETVKADKTEPVETDLTNEDF